MSFAQQNQPWITEQTKAAYSQILGTIPNYQGHVQQLDTSRLLQEVMQMVDRHVAQKMQQGLQPQQPEVINTIYATVHGHIGLYMWQACGIQLSGFDQSMKWLNSVRNAPHAAQPSGWNAPTSQGWNNNMNSSVNSGQMMTNTGGAFISPGAEAPPHHPTTSGSSFTDNLLKDQFTNQSIPAEETKMNKSDHFVNAALQPTPSQYEFKEEEKPKVRKPPAVNHQVVDKTDVVITGSGDEKYVKLFMGNDEALEKCVLSEFEEVRTLPVLNPKDDLGDIILGLFGSETMDDFIGRLNGIKKKQPFDLMTGWIDAKLSSLLEDIIRYRLGVKVVEVASYLSKRADISDWLRSKGELEATEEILLDYIDRFTTVTDIETVIDGKTTKTSMIVTEHRFVLSLPWRTRYSSRTQSLWIEDISADEIHDIFTKAFGLVDSYNIYLDIVDASMVEYRVYRKGDVFPCEFAVVRK